MPNFINSTHEAIHKVAGAKTAIRYKWNTLNWYNHNDHKGYDLLYLRESFIWSESPEGIDFWIAVEESIAQFEKEW